MKKYFVCAVFDVKVSSFMAPFLAPALGKASRFFEDMLADQGMPFGKHPEDYRLFHLGSFDEDTGRFENLDAPMLIVDGEQLSAPVLREVRRG